MAAAAASLDCDFKLNSINSAIFFLYLSVHTFAYAKNLVKRQHLQGLPPSVGLCEKGAERQWGRGHHLKPSPSLVAPCNLCAPATTYGHVNSCDNIRYDVTHSHTHSHTQSHTGTHTVTHMCDFIFYAKRCWHFFLICKKKSCKVSQLSGRLSSASADFDLQVSATIR